jgi:hypothetical protein
MRTGSPDGTVPADKYRTAVPDLTMLPAACAVGGDLVRDGRATTRDAVGVRLREAGYRVSNARPRQLLNALRREAAAASVVRG